ELVLPHCSIGPAGARALLAWPAVEWIELCVSANPMGPDGVELVARQACRNLPPGRRVMLDLRETDLGDAGMARLAGLPELIHCDYLQADRNGITAAG